ncbi:MAG: family 43 glycosylhydrolase, partial [Acidimicrobiales bacterium]|nr:family 43 glycosylhydrolase [Acidimicrobiales bacterium]
MTVRRPGAGRSARSLVVAATLVTTAMACSSASGPDEAAPSPGGAGTSTAQTDPPGSVDAPTAAPTSMVAPPIDPWLGGDGPAWPLDFPDPYVLATADGYLAFGTTSGLIQVQRLDATGEGWVGPDEALAEVPNWATPNSSWAPAVVAVDDGYVLYYTAQVAGTDRHCISVARATDPRGPYVDHRSEPLICPSDAGGSIDPSPFVDVDGSLHLLWKNDGITLRSESRIWSQPLSADGRELAGPATPLIATDQPWEAPHVEAP